MNTPRPWTLLSALVLTSFTCTAFRASAAELVSAAPNGRSGKGSSGEPSISGDGRFVAFSTTARLLPEDSNPYIDVYVYNRDTKTLRLVSDDRGGDQPVISANGRFVAFRSIDDFPKIRSVDLETNEPPRTISVAFNNASFRYGESPVISPDGQFIGFSFYPIPSFNNSTNPQVVSFDQASSNRLAASKNITGQFLLDTLGRVALARNGATAFFETHDAIIGVDNNDEQDIYAANNGSSVVVCVSATAQTGGGKARDPVVSSDGRTVYFLSDVALSSSDDDGGTTIYKATSIDNFTSGVTPEAIPAPVKPVALSKQATSDGSFIVFLGKKGAGAIQPYVLKTSTGEVRSLGASAVLDAGAPVISADNSTIAYATSKPVSERDGNGASDIAVVPNPFADAVIPPPTITLIAPVSDTSTTAGSSVRIAASASSPSVGMWSIALEVNGRRYLSGTNAFDQNIADLPLGPNRIRVVALNNANVPAVSNTIIVDKHASGNGLAITAPPTVRAEGGTELSGTIRLQNGSATGPFQVLLVEVPTGASWESFGDRGSVPLPGENVLDVINFDTIGLNEDLPYSAMLSQTFTTGVGFQGLAWNVVARLRQFSGGDFVDRSQVTLANVLPRLSDDTPGPNGGVPVLGPEVPTTFNPTQFLSLAIQGPQKVVAGSSIAYKAVATFNTGPRPCTPQWEIIQGGNVASISPAGILTTKNASGAATIQLKATFGGKQTTLNILSTPVSPKVSIRTAANAMEGGDSGRVRVTRTPVTNEALTVTYAVSGRATSGIDFTALPGTLTIPAGKAAAEIEIKTLNDVIFEGTETVVLALQESGQYRVTSARSATVMIGDDEAFPSDQADLVLQAPGGKPVGAMQIAFFDGSREQQAFARGVRNRATTFKLQAINRGTAAKDLFIDSDGDFLGFRVRFFSGSQDVTQAIMDGTFSFTAVPAGESRALTVKITPTSESPLGSMIRCRIGVQPASSSHDDYGEVAVERVR